MLDDRELCEQLKNIYETTGIDLLGTEKEDNSSAERELNERLKELDASARELDECEKYYMFAPKSELFGITEDIEALVQHEEKVIYVKNRRPTDISVMYEQLSIPFEVMPHLIHFLGWLVDSRDVGKE